MLDLKNTALKAILKALDIFVSQEFGKDVVITSLFRSNEEQQALYKEEVRLNPNFKVPVSHHQYWLAADIRSSIYTPQEIERMVKFLNCFTFPAADAVATYHAIAGNTNHFHIKYRERKYG